MKSRRNASGLLFAAVAAKAAIVALASLPATAEMATRLPYAVTSVAENWIWVAGGMVPFLFGRFWKKTTGVGALSSMFTGALFALLNMKGITHFPTSLFCLIPAAIVCVIVSLCTQKKEPAETKAE